MRESKAGAVKVATRRSSNSATAMVHNWWLLRLYSVLCWTRRDSAMTADASVLIASGLMAEERDYMTFSKCELKVIKRRREIRRAR